MLRDLFSLFPAYAGVIPFPFQSGGPARAFPRICGGDPCHDVALVLIAFFSPHMRG